MAGKDNEANTGTEKPTGLRLGDRIVTDELRCVRSILGEWLKFIEKTEKPVDIENFRAEIGICASKLEGILAAEG